MEPFWCLIFWQQLTVNNLINSPELFHSVLGSCGCGWGSMEQNQALVLIELRVIASQLYGIFSNLLKVLRLFVLRYSKDKIKGITRR